MGSTQATAENLSELLSRAEQRIAASIDEPAQNPRPVGSKKLTDADEWRIRVGDYRIVYSIQDAQLIVLVIKIAHRREVYRG